MTRILQMDGLPPPLAAAMRPWIDIVGGASLGMGEEVRAAAANACTSLERRVVMGSSLEAAMDDARRGASALADELDRRGGQPTELRVKAVDALGVLIAGLREAKPNERAKGLGLDW